jgi:hypothetical protein
MDGIMKTSENSRIRPFAPKFRKDSGDSAVEAKAASYTEYGAGVVFDDDVSDSAEYLETIHRKVALEPEKHLILAVLEDAVVCFQKNLYARTAKKRTEFEEAEAWILNEEDRALFSFESVCNILGIEPGYLRLGLMEWKKEKARTRAATQAKAA